MDHLFIHERPRLYEPRMVLGFKGWMDGGHVSTGTVELLAQTCEARKFAEIDSLEFYIHNFPVATLPLAILSDGDRAVVRATNPMEQAAIFRPHTEISDGLIRRLTFQRNDFLGSEAAALILFSGEEPHIRWRTYADCLLGLAEDFGVRDLYFVGSVASPIPHTREPRVHLGVSHEQLKDAHRDAGLDFTNYEGPASFVTLLLTLAAARGLRMRSLVVELPHYPFLDIPTYPASLLRVASLLAEWLGLDLPLAELRRAAAAVGKQLDDLMAQNDDFRNLVRRLEDAYDAEEASDEQDVLRRLMDQIDLGEEGQGP